MPRSPGGQGTSFAACEILRKALTGETFHKVILSTLSIVHNILT